jgi:hypothetical protein
MMFVIPKALRVLPLALLVLSPFGCSWMPLAPKVEERPRTVASSHAEQPQTGVTQNLPDIQAVPPPQPVPQYFTYTVRHLGETLFSIARWYTGEGANWKQLARVNPGLDFLRIHVGDTIFIPEALLITRQPMPKSTLPIHSAGRPKVHAVLPKVQAVHGPKPESVKSKPAAAPALFGPIESAPDTEGTLPQPLQRLDESE